MRHQEREGEVPLPGFDEFFKTTYPRVLVYARFLARDVVDAELAVAAAYAETAKRWTRVHEFEVPEGYVRRLVRQRLEGQRRRQLRRVLAELKGQLSPRPADPELSEEARLVLDLLRRLPDRQRAVMALVCLEYTSGEIAQELRMTPSTVRTYIERARKRLRDMLGRGPGSGASRADEFVSAVSGRRGSTSPFPSLEQDEHDQLASLLHRGEAELREAFADDQARMERIRAAIAARVAGRCGRRSR